jgi:hypothetical protein
MPAHCLTPAQLDRVTDVLRMRQYRDEDLAAHKHDTAAVYDRIADKLLDKLLASIGEPDARATLRNTMMTEQSR